MENKIEISKFEYLKNKFAGTHLIVSKHALTIVILLMNNLFFISNCSDNISIFTQIVRATVICVVQLSLPLMVFKGYIKIRDNIYKGNIALRIVCCIAWIACLYFSTMALKGYTLEQAQKTKNNIYYNSEEYKSSKGEIDSLKEQLKLKNTLLDTENKNYSICVGSDTENKQSNNKNWDDLNNQIKQKESQISTINNQITNNKNAGLKESGTTIINQRNEIKKLESDKKQLITSRDALTGNKSDASNIIQARIDKLNSEIVDLQNKISDKDKNIITQKTTTKKKTSYDFAFGSSAEIATTLLYYLLELIYLILCIITDKSIKEDKTKYYKVEIDNIEPPKLAKYNDIDLDHLAINNLNNVYTDIEKELKPVKASINNKVVEQKNKINEFKDDKDFQIFYNFIKENLINNNECMGYMKVAKMLNISDYKANRFFGHLEKMGKIVQHPTKKNRRILVK